MDIDPQYYQTFRLLKCCVIIPTYNNANTLRRVLDGVLWYTDAIIVVNDGSTDATGKILEGYGAIKQIHLLKNRGKGNALRAGFKAAKEAGFDHAITIDSDGQHFPDDIPKFITALEKEGNTLLIGSRNMHQEGVPKKSSFGNKFSNFWFLFETGIKLDDTQSGYRLYPLRELPKKFFTPKFEFEIEVIVRAAWKGIPVRNIPIKVLYDPDERISHFRPFRDFTRISILNTVLVIISLLYIKPRDVVRNLKKKGVKKFFLENVLENDDSSAKKALSIALGVFIGIVPLWGLQTVTVLFLAYMLRLNKVIAFAFSNISVPPMIPLIVFASLQAGSLFVPGNASFSDNATIMESMGANLLQYLIGSLAVAVIAAVVFGFAGYLLFTFSPKLKIQKNA